MEKLIGKKVEIIDEYIKPHKSMGVFTIKSLNGRLIEFEEQEGITPFFQDKDVELFKKGKKAYLHPDEVSIKLI